MKTNPDCVQCCRYWRADGEGICLRHGPHDYVPVEFERDGGRVWSKLMGLCGEHGRYFQPRVPR